MPSSLSLFLPHDRRSSLFDFLYRHLEIEPNFTNDDDEETMDDHLELQKDIIASTLAQVIPLLPSLRTITSFFHHPLIFKAAVDLPRLERFFAVDDEDVVRSLFDELHLDDDLPSATSITLWSSATRT